MVGLYQHKQGNSKLIQNGAAKQFLKTLKSNWSSNETYMSSKLRTILLKLPAYRDNIYFTIIIQSFIQNYLDNR